MADGSQESNADGGTAQGGQSARDMAGQDAVSRVARPEITKGGREVEVIGTGAMSLAAVGIVIVAARRTPSS